MYDVDKSGSLDYKEFGGMLFGREISGGSPAKGGSSNPEDLMSKLKQKLASRGARGIIGLGKQFKIMDDNNSRSLDMYEFTKAMKDYMLGFNESEIKNLFNYFDVDKSGELDYDEFIRGIRGPMNNFRKKFVIQAFNKMDKDKNGYIDINDMKGVYNATKHPDVTSGKKTEEQVLMEFLETFEVQHSMRNNTAPDHIVTQDEFIEYYNNIAASMDNDQHFEIMINNAWKINDADRSYGKAWTNKEEEKKGGAPQSFKKGGAQGYRAAGPSGSG